MTHGNRFPTRLHQDVADDVVESFMASSAEAVLLVNSCARGMASPQSDLDLAVLVRPDLPMTEKRRLEEDWRRHYRSHTLFRKFEATGRFACVHLDVFDGRFEAERWDDGGGPDAFEIELGNRVAHAVPLWERGTAFADLRAHWLPYYDENLRAQRLSMVVEACRRDLERIAVGVRRSLYFYGFDRLCNAFKEFLQAVFIARRVYPIAYDKWIREQVEEWLGLPDLYAELPLVLQVQSLESVELLGKAQHLGALLERWTVEESAGQGVRRSQEARSGEAEVQSHPADAEEHGF